MKNKWKITLAFTMLAIALLSSSHLTIAGRRDISPELLHRGTLSATATWAKAYGGMGDDVSSSMAMTGDGGYIVVGRTNSFGVGNNDFWVLKLDGSGNITWQKTYGGTGFEYAISVAQASDGGYIVAGYTSSFGAGNSDFWLLKLDGLGNVIWQKTYGGTDSEAFARVAPTNDGGYIVAGSTTSFGAGGSDFWVMKLDGSGIVTWQKTYGSSGNEFAGFIVPTGDGSYIVAGSTTSFGAGGYDAWVLKLDGAGNITWQKTYGSIGDEQVIHIVPTSDGSYIVAGGTSSFGAGNYDAWVVKLDETGNVIWQKTYGGGGDDYADFVFPTSDGGYVVSADTASFGTGGKIWVLKLDGLGNITWQRIYGGSGRDSPNPIFPTSDGGYILAGWTTSFGAGGSDILVLKMDGDGNIADMCPPPSSTLAMATNSSASIAMSVATVMTRAITPGTTTATVSTSSATVQRLFACNIFLFLPLILR